MLIRFNVENFLSFNDRQEFSLIPGKGQRLPSHVIKAKNRNDIPVLKSAIIYGNNASGKSNLVKALDFAQDFITNSKRVGQTLRNETFRLEFNSSKKPSRFEFEIKIKNKNFAYGFIYNSNEIIEEWLFEISKKKEKCIFNRNTKKKIVEVKTDIRLDKENEQFFKFIAKGTKPNQLFLTECMERNANFIKEINDVFNWFNKVLVIIFPDSAYGGLEFEISNNQKLQEKFAEFLSLFDTGICGIEIKELKDLENEIKDVPIDFLNKITEDLAPQKKAIISADNRYAISKDANGIIKSFKLMTKHRMKDSENFQLFEIKDESHGTQRLFDLIPAFLKFSTEENVFIIDELDRSLHPSITSTIFDLFFKHSINISNQLVVTTHDINLLSLKKFRKDEIWFIEKNKYGESKVYSLEEFNPRYDKDIRKGYLLGRFGAIPQKTT